MLLFPLNISFIDWSADTFLFFYSVLLICAVIWALLKRAQGKARFEASEPTDSLDDLYELAYLAGGSRRCTQLAIARLVKNKSFNFIKKSFSSHILTVNQLYPDAHPTELAFYHLVDACGKRGFKLKDAPKKTAHLFISLQNNLAKRGLRPLAEEITKLKVSIWLPFILLLLLASLRIIFDYIRDEDILFTIILTIITLTVAITISSIPYLTKSGNTLLEYHRIREQKHLIQDANSENFTTLAVFGPAELSSSKLLSDLSPELTREISAYHPTSDKTTKAGGCGGCSSGCSSGCGGGGCGGCGGCG